MIRERQKRPAKSEKACSVGDAMAILAVSSDKEFGLLGSRGAVMMNMPSPSKVSPSGLSGRESAADALARRIQQAAGQVMHAWSVVGSKHIADQTPDRAECDKVRRQETPPEVFIG